jgi:hypothetical protein
MSSEWIPGKPGAGGGAPNTARPVAIAPTPAPLPASAAAKSVQNPAANQAAPNPSQPPIPAPSKIPWPTIPATIAQKPAATYKCPKCGTDARDVARFCPKCHATLRYECPSCHNNQRAGGKCEKCGVDFLKYIGAVVAAKKAEADAVHERLESRSGLLKGLLWLPFNGGMSLVRYFFLKRDRQ